MNDTKRLAEIILEINQARIEFDQRLRELLAEQELEIKRISAAEEAKA